jgi:hypothetical protein
MMRRYPSLAEYLGWRSASGGRPAGDLTGWSGDAGCDPVAERSLFTGVVQVGQPGPSGEPAELAAEGGVAITSRALDALEILTISSLVPERPDRADRMRA